jgi:nucleotide-binding universal stress UspA family protein
MAMKVLLAVDGSEYSRACVALMKRLPMPKDTEVNLFTVIESGALFGREGLQVPENEAGALAAVETAEELGVDHIVVGSHGLTGFHRFLLGSVTARVVDHAPCSVWIVR